MAALMQQYHVFCKPLICFSPLPSPNFRPEHYLSSNYLSERMADALAGATVGLLLENLLSVAKEEIGLFWNFNDDLGNLKQSVVMIRNLLEDAEEKQLNNDNSVKFWLMKLESVALDADYIFDEINYRVLRKKVQRDNNMVRRYLPFTDSLAFSHKMAKKIKDIKIDLNSVYEEANKLGLQTRIAGAPARVAGAETPAYLETDPYSMDPVFVGREQKVTNVVELLTSSRLTEEAISVFPIFGMGGLGKTTLARKVFNDEKIVSQFGERERIWVHVKEDFDPVIVLKNILESLTGEKVDGSRAVVLKKLGDMLKEKRYLLVLDNVWNEEALKWENFINSLKGISQVKGNVIMVTTRKASVASIVKTLDVDQLEGLSEEDCWSIIKAKSFKGEDVPSEFETIGKNIAQRCGGLPLAAQVVGSLLRDKYSKDKWVSIEKNWISDIGGGNAISKILKLSFDNLPSPSLKNCFAWCSFVPKGWWMEKDEVIQLWMAQGLLQTNQENNMEVFGNWVFNVLVHSSLLQVRLRDSYGNAKRCILHDLVYDFASSVLNSDSSDGLSRRPNKYGRCWRALFVGDVPETTHMKSVHILILHGEDMKELPIEIGKLICLRYLDISQTRIECLPESVGDLYHLQTLRATQEFGGEGCLRKLPDTFKYLISLRHLYIPNIKLPPGIENLIALRTLPYFHVGGEEGCGIMELRKLTKLSGEIEIHNLENVCDKEGAKSADLFHKPNISKLKFVWNNVCVEEGERNTNNDENVLEGLQPHPNLKVLEIEGFKGTSFPSWTSRMAVRENVEDRWAMLDNLLEIKLSDCKECEDVPMLGHLPHLKFLYLHQLSSVKSLGYAFYGIEQNVGKETIVVFPTLEKLELVGMESLMAWEDVAPFQTQVSMFPRIEYLKINNCRELMSAPSKFPCLKELEIDNMKSGLALESICGSNLTSLAKLKIHGVEELVRLPYELFRNNRDLIELAIRNCNKLRQLVPCFGCGGASLRKFEIQKCRNFEELPEDLHNLKALEELVIGFCPNLKSIAYPLSSQGGFISLWNLQIISCVGLTNFPIQMIESCASSLEQMHLTGSSSITNLPQVMSIVVKMPRLTVLEISRVPKFSDVVAEIGSLHRLERLGFGGSSDCRDYVSFQGSLDRILPTLQCLHLLVLMGTEYWDALPDQLRHLTSLERLLLTKFGVEALPEWLGNWSSLKELKLRSFRNLRFMPSKKAMQSLAKLTVIHVSNCPLFEQSLEDRASPDSEWHKISHIPIIIVDDRQISALPQ